MYSVFQTLHHRLMGSKYFCFTSFFKSLKICSFNTESILGLNECTYQALSHYWATRRNLLNRQWFLNIISAILECFNSEIESDSWLRMWISVTFTALLGCFSELATVSTLCNECGMEEAGSLNKFITHFTQSCNKTKLRIWFKWGRKFNFQCGELPLTGIFIRGFSLNVVPLLNTALLTPIFEL